MVIEVRSFERIAYLIVEHCLKSEEVGKKGERERRWMGKGKLMQQMVVITLPILI